MHKLFSKTPFQAYYFVVLAVYCALPKFSYLMVLPARGDRHDSQGQYFSLKLLLLLSFMPLLKFTLSLWPTKLVKSYLKLKIRTVKFWGHWVELDGPIILKKRQMTKWIKRDKATKIPGEIWQLDKRLSFRSRNYTHFFSPPFFSGCLRTQRWSQMTPSSRLFTRAVIGGCL